MSSATITMKNSARNTRIIFSVALFSTVLCNIFKGSRVFASNRDKSGHIEMLDTFFYIVDDYLFSLRCKGMTDYLSRRRKELKGNDTVFRVLKKPDWSRFSLFSDFVKDLKECEDNPSKLGEAFSSAVSMLF